MFKTGKRLRRADGRMFDRDAYQAQRVECFRSGQLVGARCRHPYSDMQAQDQRECRPIRCTLCQDVLLRKDPFEV